MDLKAILQIMAALGSDRSVRYISYNDMVHKNQLGKCLRKMGENLGEKLTVAWLFERLVKYWLGSFLTANGG